MQLICLGSWALLATAYWNLRLENVTQLEGTFLIQIGSALLRPSLHLRTAIPFLLSALFAGQARAEPVVPVGGGNREEFANASRGTGVVCGGCGVVGEMD